MQDGNFSVDGLRRLSGADITRFAVDVVAKVAAFDSAPSVVLKQPLVAAMVAAVRSPEQSALRRLCPDFKRARITNEMLADHYIPEVARRLGRGWEEDSASFAEVTIGTARLQAFLNDIGRTWAADGTDGPAGSTVLLVVPRGEQHTLGALVAAGWLRRKGISVCLRIAPTPAELAAILAQRRFDGAMISVACDEKLDTCTGLVKTLREETSNGLRIALGGAMMEREVDFATVTGVDIVTNDLPKAVQALGLTCKRPLLTVIT
ncbi:MAG: B12-binding domain-containing protein [Paracoccaceae bacterium]